MAQLNAVCVFCGSSTGNNAAFTAAARRLGAEVARRGWDVVYGGGRVGLMGELADAALTAGGKVIGVIPRSLLEREVGHHGLTKLHVVHTMHERKALMAELCGGFIALPGGLGTLEELFEVWTWAQLGIHQKPVGLLNVDGFHDRLLEFLSGAVESQLLKRENLDILLVEREVPALLDRMASYRPVVVDKWLAREDV